LNCVLFYLIHLYVYQIIYIYRYSDFLPGKNLIIALSTSLLFFSLEEFVGAYSDPYHIELESEQVWPIEKLIQF
jgi:hypothetical protein